MKLLLGRVFNEIIDECTSVEADMKSQGHVTQNGPINAQSWPHNGCISRMTSNMIEKLS